MTWAPTTARPDAALGTTRAYLRAWRPILRRTSPVFSFQHDVITRVCSEIIAQNHRPKSEGNRRGNRVVVSLTIASPPIPNGPQAAATPAAGGAGRSMRGSDSDGDSDDVSMDVSDMHNDSSMETSTFEEL